MDKKVLQAPAQIESVSTLKDGTIKLSVYTQELPPEEMTALFSLRGAMGWFMFAHEIKALDDIDIPDIKTEFKEDKSPSVRLRNVIYVYGQKLKKKDSDTFYKTQMERIIELFKEKIDNL